MTGGALPLPAGCEINTTKQLGTTRQQRLVTKTQTADHYAMQCGPHEPGPLSYLLLNYADALLGYAENIAQGKYLHGS
jgi:hypothetical protein